MTRIGINPARGKVTDRLPAPVTVAVLTYLPNLAGYFEQRLEVLKLVLASLKAHTTPDHELYVFDNGSCESVVDYLVPAAPGGTDRLPAAVAAQPRQDRRPAHPVQRRAGRGDRLQRRRHPVLPRLAGGASGSAAAFPSGRHGQRCAGAQRRRACPQKPGTAG